MGKGVSIRIKSGGKVEVEWEGFRGQACYLEAQKLYALLKNKGVDVEIKEIKPILSAGKEEKVAVATKQIEMGGI